MFRSFATTMRTTFALGVVAFMLKLPENYFWLTEEKVNLEPWSNLYDVPSVKGNKCHMD